jgi:hypothetical protein
MSYNIPKSILKHSKGITVTIDLNTFTDRQMKNIQKAVLSGQTKNKNGTATSLIAASLLRKYKLPHVDITYHYMSWSNIPPEHELFDLIKNQLALAKITQDKPYYSMLIDEALTKMNTRPATGSSGLWMMSYANQQDLRDQLKQTKLTISSEHPIHKDLADIINRVADTYNVELPQQNGD